MCILFSRRRLNNRFLEIQEQLAETVNKLTTSEKAKTKLQAQYDVLIEDYDKVYV